MHWVRVRGGVGGRKLGGLGGRGGGHRRVHQGCRVDVAQGLQADANVLQRQQQDLVDLVPHCWRLAAAGTTAGRAREEGRQARAQVAQLSPTASAGPPQSTQLQLSGSSVTRVTNFRKPDGQQLARSYGTQTMYIFLKKKQLHTILNKLHTILKFYIQFKKNTSDYFLKNSCVPKNLSLLVGYY